MRNLPGSKTLAAAALLAAASLWLLPAPALAGNSTQVERSFRHFCSQWMDKLERREQRNAARVKFVRRGLQLVGEYNGYARRPSSCRIETTGVREAPYVGKLSYREHLYRKAGSSRRRARRSDPRLLSSTEVLEIFRYNGKIWIY